MIVGIANNGTVLGVRVLAHQETPGLGDKIDLRISNWVLGFNGQQVTADNQDDWKVRKDGGQFDQFTGATITPRAVVLAVKKAVEYVNQHQQQLHNQPNPCEVNNMNENRTLMLNGMWNNNPALVQLLGLCPLLAVSSTVTNALGLGIATLLVLVGSNVTVSLVRDYVPKEVRIPVFVMIIASLVTCVQLLMNAYAYGLYLSLGIFIPLIVTNCIIIGRAEAFASKNDVLPAALDGFWMGLGMTSVLVVLGSLREIIGNGTLFDGADLLLGEWAKSYASKCFTLTAPFAGTAAPVPSSALAF